LRPIDGAKQKRWQSRGKAIGAIDGVPDEKVGATNCRCELAIDARQRMTGYLPFVPSNGSANVLKSSLHSV
jgi:hypothetical protein